MWVDDIVDRRELRDQLKKIEMGIQIAGSDEELEPLLLLKRRLEQRRDELFGQSGASAAATRRPLPTVHRLRAQEFRMEVDRYVGRRVRTARFEAYIDQAALGEAIGLSQRRISDIEKGKRSLSVSELLRVSIELRKPALFFLEPAHPDVVTSGWERARPDTSC